MFGTIWIVIECTKEGYATWEFQNILGYIDYEWIMIWYDNHEQTETTFECAKFTKVWHSFTWSPKLYKSITNLLLAQLFT